MSKWLWHDEESCYCSQRCIGVSIKMLLEFVLQKKQALKSPSLKSFFWCATESSHFSNPKDWMDWNCTIMGEDPKTFCNIALHVIMLPCCYTGSQSTLLFSSKFDCACADLPDVSLHQKVTFPSWAMFVMSSIACSLKCSEFCSIILKVRQQIMIVFMRHGAWKDELYQYLAGITSMMLGKFAKR